jgi:hypothetical protein
MAWKEITTAEIAPRQPLDSELFSKIRNNLYLGLSAIGLPSIIPNGSFEHTTGVLPILWNASTHSGGSASVSTGAHGRYSLKLTHPGGNGQGGGEVWTDDFIPVGSSALTIHGMVWASATGVKGGVKIRVYNSSYVLTSSASTNHSSYLATPSTMAMTMQWVGAAKFAKIGCICGTDSTVAGSIYFDALYIADT